MTTGNDDTWEMIRCERAALVDALDELKPDDWEKSSLCAGWSHQDVLAHLVFAASVTPIRYVGNFCRDFVASRFRPQLAVGRHVHRITASNTPQQLIAACFARGSMRKRTHPRPSSPFSVRRSSTARTSLLRLAERANTRLAISRRSRISTLRTTTSLGRNDACEASASRPAMCNGAAAAARRSRGRF